MLENLTLSYHNETHIHHTIKLEQTLRKITCGLEWWKKHNTYYLKSSLRAATAATTAPP